MIRFRKCNLKNKAESKFSKNYQSNCRGCSCFWAILLTALLVFSSFSELSIAGEQSILISEEQAKNVMISILSEHPDHSAIAYLAYVGKEDIVMVDEEEITESKPMWLGFIDDLPGGLYEHPTRFVFIYTSTDDETVESEWYPTINGVPIWEVGEVILPPLADYGDAPYGTRTYSYDIISRFPTLYTNNGAHTLYTGEEILGVFVSEEAGAVDPHDPDGLPNLVDNDKDDGFVEITSDSRFVLNVTIAPSAPERPRYINILADLNGDGTWDSSEWILVNYEINVVPGTTEQITTDAVSFAGALYLLECWVRIALTTSKIRAEWDGTGEFDQGEIEDYLMCSPPGGGPPVIPPEPPEKRVLRPETEYRCDKEVHYYALVINGIESGEGQDKGKQAADGMFNALSKHYETWYLRAEERKSTKKNIQSTIRELARKIECQDKFLIYIIGHGKKGRYNLDKEFPTGGISLSDGVLTPKELDTYLKNAPWKEKRKNNPTCYITILIESCYAGNFETLGAPGRTLIFSSTSTASKSGYDGTGGEFSDAFLAALKDPDAAGPNNCISDVEAYNFALQRDRAQNEGWIDAKGEKVYTDPQIIKSGCTCVPNPPKYPEDIIQGIHSVFYQYHDVLELHIYLVSDTFDGEIYGIEIFPDAQLPSWESLEGLEAPTNWSFESTPMGVRFYTETDPLRKFPAQKFVVRVKGKRISWFIRVYAKGENQETIGIIISRRWRLYNFYLM
jgi:hypothetical protein